MVNHVQKAITAIDRAIDWSMYDPTDPESPRYLVELEFLFDKDEDQEKIENTVQSIVSQFPGSKIRYKVSEMDRDSVEGGEGGVSLYGIYPLTKELEEALNVLYDSFDVDIYPQETKGM